MNATSHGRDLYVRHTDENGKTVVREHRVWDADRFLSSQQAEAKKTGGKAAVQQVTREDYLKERTK